MIQLEINIDSIGRVSCWFIDKRENFHTYLPTKVTPLLVHEFLRAGRLKETKGVSSDRSFSFTTSDKKQNDNFSEGESHRKKDINRAGGWGSEWW